MFYWCKRPGLTCLRGINLAKSSPCFISPLWGNHVGMPETISALMLFHFPVHLCCVPLSCTQPVKYISVKPCAVLGGILVGCSPVEVYCWGMDVSEYSPPAPHPVAPSVSGSSFYRLTLLACREVFCWLPEELLLDPSNTFPIQWSCSLIVEPCLFKGIICTAQTWVGPC